MGGSPDENKTAIERVFAGEGAPAHTAAIAMNAGALLFLAGKATSFKAGADMALASIAAGKPLETIKHAAQLSQQHISQ